MSRLPSFLFVTTTIAAIFGAMGPAQGQTQPQAPASASAANRPFVSSAPLSLMLKNAQWFDGAAFKRGTLYVVDGKFTATKPKQVNRSMDLKNQFLLPPLAEAHNYNLQNEWGADRFANRYVAEGVFYAAMLCGDPAGVDPVRPRFAKPETPDVAFVTACVTSSDGQPLPALVAASPGKTKADFIDKAVIVMDKPEDVERKWPLVMGRKSDALRLVLAHSGRQGLNAETAIALAQRARKAGLRVIAHVETAADFDLALRAGVDVIDHIPGYAQMAGEPPERFQISAESAVQANRQKVSVITGLAASQLFKLRNPQTELLKRNLLVLKEAGVNLLLGSDLFTDTAQAELKALAATQVFTNVELLRMATIATPHALFPKRQLGCFEPGCEASFLLLAEDPIEKLEAVQQPLLRVKTGRLLTQDEAVADSADASSQSTDAPAKKKATAAKKKPAQKKKTTPLQAPSTEHRRTMDKLSPPSSWLLRWAATPQPGKSALDLACGNGRHLPHLLELGMTVTGVDRDVAATSPWAARVEIINADIEAGPWPLNGRRFDLVLVTNYLWRPLLPTLVDSVAPGGWLIYETFASGQETIGRPSRPDFLLQPGELIQACSGLRIAAYEDLYEPGENPRFVQRIAAVRPD